MTDPALRVCIRSASRAGRLPVLSSPLGSGKFSKPCPCSRSSLVSRETLSLRMAGMCSLGVTVQVLKTTNQIPALLELTFQWGETQRARKQQNKQKIIVLGCVKGYEGNQQQSGRSQGHRVYQMAKTHLPKI